MSLIMGPLLAGEVGVASWQKWLSTQSSVCKRGVEADVQDSQPANYTSDEQIQLVHYFQMPSMKINLIKKKETRWKLATIWLISKQKRAV